MGVVRSHHAGLGVGTCEGAVRMMDQTLEQQQMEQTGGVGDLYVKVMTDEQMELLRRQISVYASICEQLAEMHKAISDHHDLAGMRLGSLYCDPLLASATHKITARQRWTPTPSQLEILEHVFRQGNGTPSKQKIKEMTTELLQHGKISETNVSNWFQNRRARSKRKQPAVGPNIVESEADETDVELPKDKVTKPENMQSHENAAAPMAENLHLPDPVISHEMHCLDTQPNMGETIFPSDSDLRSSDNLGHLSFYENLPSNQRSKQLISRMGVPWSFSPYGRGEEYDMVG